MVFVNTIIFKNFKNQILNDCKEKKGVIKGEHAGELPCIVD